MAGSLEKAFRKLSRTCLLSHGTFPCEVVDDLLMIVISEECMDLPDDTLGPVVRGLASSIIFPYKKKKFRERFNNLHDDIKIHLVTKSNLFDLSHLLTSTQDERTNHLNVLRTIPSQHESILFY